jgi:hypothetical protein
MALLGRAPLESSPIFAMDCKAAVDALFKEWGGRRLTVAQAPVEMDFGYTFVMLDPDPHRLRVYASNGS